jgi:cysteine-rich repeat protein
VAFCGDGKVDPGEQCDLGGANADRPALQVLQGGLALGVTPVQKTQSASAFYNYFSGSGHTGFEVLGASEMFFHRNSGTGLLSLIVEHGIDASTTGQMQPTSHVIMDLTGLPATATIALSDEPNEALPQGATGLHADWHFQNNTDGFVLSGLPLPGTWSITVSPQFLQGIASWTWVKPDGSIVSFDLVTPVVLTAFSTPSLCRTDCSVPHCGDGILDGGEVCDDGNTVGGDGCAADCKSLQ